MSANDVPMIPEYPGLGSLNSGRSPRLRQWTAEHVDDDPEVPMVEICPDQDTFSYFMLAQPREKKQGSGAFSMDSLMSVFLVFMTLACQAILLYCVYNKVVIKNEQWKDGIMDTGRSDMSLFAPPSDGCNDGNSLCTLMNGTFTCAPPSVQLSGRWDELDLNNDGVWTRAEAMESHDSLKCKYGLDSVEVFDVYNHLIMNRNDLVWIHPDVKEGKSIHKHYFDYARGDIVMCGYRNEDMCGNLLKRGFFDAPLAYGTAPRVGTTIDSALEYCRSMLQPRGTCEKVLPSSYQTWKVESVEQCGEPRYTKFIFEHPGEHGKASHRVKSSLEVDYKQRQKYDNAQTTVFQCYKGVIVGVWILLIVSQLRGVAVIMSWVIMFPTEEDEEEENEPETAISSARRSERKQRASIMAMHIKHEELTARKPNSARSSQSHVITGIDHCHRFMLFFVTCLRVFMLCVLMYVGLQFLARQTDYIGLLLDGIALIFIIEVAEILYLRVLRQEVRAKWEEHDPLWHTPMALFTSPSKPAIMDMFWLLVVIVATVGFLWNLGRTLVDPLSEALDCTCRTAGNKCREASAFDFDFWTNYWRYDVPETLKNIAALKETTLGKKSDSMLEHHHGAHHHARHHYHLG